jgi:hypothetical protein
MNVETLTVYGVNKKIALIVLSPLLTIATVAALPGTAATSTGKVGGVCKKAGAKGKTAKGSALVCKKSGATLKWKLAPKSAADTTLHADTTVKS